MNAQPWLARSALWGHDLAEHRQRLQGLPGGFKASGSVVRMVGLVLEAVGFQASVGQRSLYAQSGAEPFRMRTRHVVGIAAFAGTAESDAGACVIAGQQRKTGGFTEAYTCAIG